MLHPALVVIVRQEGDDAAGLVEGDLTEAQAHSEVARGLERGHSDRDSMRTTDMSPARTRATVVTKPPTLKLPALLGKKNQGRCFWLCLHLKQILMYQ